MIQVINTAIKLPLCVAAKGEIRPEILFRKFQLHPAMRYLCILITLLLSSNLFSQEANTYIFKGNEAYKKRDYETATEQYKEALRKDPTNNIARFNYANALQKQNEAEKSEKEYDGIIASSKNTSINAHSFYNKGLAQLKQNKLSDAVHAFKQALKLNSEDTDTRDNLQLAINQLKKQQQKQQEKPQQQKQNQKKPQQKPLKVNKQMMEQKFAELRNQEKQLQKQLQKKSNSGQPEKDW